MKTILILLIILMASSLNLHAEPEEKVLMGIVTGSSTGTYYQFGLNIQDLVLRENISLRVDPSKGSVENIYAVYKRPVTQLGIVQSDVLAFVSRVQSDPVLKRIAKKTKLVFPLYNEEIHILGKKEIGSFEELAGKKVAIGKEGSGTYLTSKLLFKVSSIKPGEMILTDTGEALKRLKAGDIDAMFYVAGYPVKLFSDNVSEKDGLSLIPITNSSILEFYPGVSIPAGVYPWQHQDIPTAAVKAVLVSFDFRRYHCRNVGRVASLIYGNLDWLGQNGHPKWKTVDLDHKLKGWERYDCVENFLAGVNRNKKIIKKKPSEINPVLDAIKGILQD